MSQKRRQIYSARFSFLDLDPLIKYRYIFSGTSWMISSTLSTIIAETRLQSQGSSFGSFYRQNVTWRVSLPVLQFSLSVPFHHCTTLTFHSSVEAIDIHNWECHSKHSKYNSSAMYIPRHWQPHYLTQINKTISRSRWPCRLRCGPAVPRLLRLLFRIPSEA